MPTFSITRRNPRTGRIERPWKNREGFFVLGDPAHGAQKHHDKFSVKLRDLDAVVDHVRRGFSLRMTDGESPASLISPESLEITEIADDDTAEASLWATTLPKPPFTEEEMLKELRFVLLAQASQIAHAGGLDYAIAFMGFETGDPLHPYCFDDPARVDLRRFAATEYMSRAYDYAFQVGACRQHDPDGIARDVRGVVQGANPVNCAGAMSPMAEPDSKCRRTADTALARWRLANGDALSVRELALLADMKEVAVRNALSKDRIAVRDGVVANVQAAEWLRQRRGFVPTRSDEVPREDWLSASRHLLDTLAFGEALRQILENGRISREALAAKAEVPRSFVDGLVSGRPIADVPALQRVGAALELDVPHFVGVAVQAALRAEGTA